MTELVTDIERIVGAERRGFAHLARAVSGERRVYLLHSGECRDSGIDLRECEYSLALDRGIDGKVWQGYEDTPVLVALHADRLVPLMSVEGL